MEAALYLLYLAGGPPLVVFALAVAITAAYALLLWLCQAEARNWRIAAAALGFAVVLGYNDWNVRPQSIAFLLAALTLWGIYGQRRRPSWPRLLLFPAVMLVWVNSHGTYVVGLALLGIWLLDETAQAIRARLGVALTRPHRLPHAAAALGMALVACLINPRGPGALAHLGGIASNPMVRRAVVEWMPPTFETTSGALFLGGLLLMAVVLAVSPRRPDLFQVLTFLVFALLGLQAARGSAWFGMALAPVLAGHLAAIAGAWRPSRAPRPVARGSLLNVAIAGVLLAGMVLSLPWLKHWLPLPEARKVIVSVDTPVAATEALLRLQPAGPIFNDMSFGSYLIWAAQPDYPVFVDTRIEFYPIELWRDYIGISAAQPGWEAKLAEYGVNTLLLNPETQAPLIAAAHASRDWETLFEDTHSALLARQRIR